MKREEEDDTGQNEYKNVTRAKKEGGRKMKRKKEKVQGRRTDEEKRR